MVVDWLISNLGTEIAVIIHNSDRLGITNCEFDQLPVLT